MADILENLDGAWNEDSKMNLMHYCDLAGQEIRRLLTACKDKAELLTAAYSKTERLEQRVAALEHLIWEELTLADGEDLPSQMLIESAYAAVEARRATVATGQQGKP